MLASYFENVLNSPYATLPRDIPLASLYEASMSPWCPLIAGFAYILTVAQFNYKRPCKNRLTSTPAQALVLLHNVFLAAYSLWTFLKVAPAIVGYFKEGYQIAGFRGLRHSYCDSSSFLWDSYILRYGYLFYLSKYYEVVDTAILLLKGKKVKPLQVYHHAGAMAAMYAGIRYRSTPIMYFVVFNSFIHAIMYTYYSFAVLRWPFPRVLKQSLTTLQILQFVLGGSIAFSYVCISLPELNIHGFVKESGRCMAADSAPAFAVWLNIAYLIPLTGLFLNFYKQSYSRKGGKKVD